MRLDSNSPYFAAVDLGSNSFHLLIARITDDKVEIVDRVKEMVQIARGIKADGHISVAAQSRASDCLQRFHERIKDIPVSQVRAVGTKALRTTRNPGIFLKAAEKALGVPIQIISGYEEARLVYTGLSHSVLNDHNHRLVVDIGGGSTEFIIGQDFSSRLLESLSIGCVTFTEKYFSKSGKKVTRKEMQRAFLATCQEMETMRNNYLRAGWQIIYGTSGTVKAIADLTIEKDGGAVISRAALDWLAGEIIENKSILSSLPDLRRSVLPAGVAILQAIFEQFGIDTMHVGDYALKEGLLYDTIGRLSDDDTRLHTVQKLQQQYGVDAEQATRIAGTAMYFWEQTGGPVLSGVSRTKVLTWAAMLHEIGLSISHSGYHHHGYYILRHSDLAGFGRYEQYILANLVRAHRKSLSPEKFEDLDENALTALLPLVVCLRLAILLHRRREDLKSLPRLSVKDMNYHLVFAKKWLDQHPLTLAGLQEEQEIYDAMGIGLSF